MKPRRLQAVLDKSSINGRFDARKSEDTTKCHFTVVVIGERNARAIIRVIEHAR